MSFELIIALADFQSYINDALYSFLDHFCTAYLDDVLIYSSTLSEHKQHIRQVLEALKLNDLYLTPKKCEFHKQQVMYLEFIIINKDIVMNFVKVQAIVQ
jgi:hypothetical protein